MKRFLWSTLCAVLLMPQIVLGDVFLFRPLPTQNLNESAGADRSNIAFTESDPTGRFNGDSFLLPQDQGFWRIDTIRTWSVASVLGDPLGTEFSDVSLYGRVRGETMQVRSTGSPNDSFSPIQTDLVRNSNPDITHRQVQYINGEDYEGVGAPGLFFPIWEHTFTNLNWIVPERTIIEFAVWGTGTTLDPSSLYGYWFNHMSNRLLSGVPQLQGDGAYLVFDFLGPNNPAFRRNPEEAQIWDKGASMNIVLTATPIAIAIPEPGTISLFGAGVVVVAFAARRRAKSNSRN